MWRLLLVAMLLVTSGSSAVADCDPNDPVTGLPDLSYSFVVWSAALGGSATLLVVPDGTGAAFGGARRPGGAVVDATIELTIGGPCGVIAHFPREDIWLEVLGGGFAPCIGGTIADADTDVNGVTHWSQPLRAGGHSQGPCTIVIMGAPVPGMPTLDLDFNSPDLNGDRVVSLADVPLFAAAFSGAYAFAADLHADGVVDLADIPVLARSLGVDCP